MQRFQVIKCNPTSYKGMLLKCNTIITKPFVYNLNPANFIKRDSLLIFHHISTNSLRLVNKLESTPVVVNISLVNFDSILIQFIPVAIFAGKRLFVQTLLGGRTATINLSSVGRFVKKSSGIKASVIITTGKQSLQVVKPYWQKRSDFSRSKFSRLTQYSELAVMSSDIRLNTAFATKFMTKKFISWKLDGVVPKSRGGRLLPDQIANSLVNWLVVVGFYSTFTAAQQAIRAGFVRVNGQVVNFSMYQVKVNDVFTLIPRTWAQVEYISLPVLIAFALVDYANGTVFIHKALNLSILHAEILIQGFSNSVPVSFADPRNTLLNRVNLLDRLLK
jgi:hypothetical protein